MKRNMVPLLAIAFVVAIISTGIFYGLFAGKLRSSSDFPGHSIVVAARDLDRGTVIQASDLKVAEAPGFLAGSFSKREELVGAMVLTPLKADEPLLAERVASRISPAGSSSGAIVPAGMRAVSIRVTGSEGLLSLLRPGARVDLQAVSERENHVELRNILQNVQVLSVTAQDSNNRAPGAIVTVLTRAQDADVVALADAGGKIRVALRNPFDEGTIAHRSMGFASVFSESFARPAVAASNAASRPVNLRVQVLSASEAALDQLHSQASAPGGKPDAGWRVARFRSVKDAANLLQGLREKHELEVVSSRRLTAGVGQPISYRVHQSPLQLRVQFAPELAGGDQLSLHVRPEISSRSSAGVGASTYDAGLAVNSSFLLESSAIDSDSGRLFPGRSWTGRHLVIFVSAESGAPNSALAVARTAREH